MSGIATRTSKRSAAADQAARSKQKAPSRASKAARNPPQPPQPPAQPQPSTLKRKADTVVETRAKGPVAVKNKKVVSTSAQKTRQSVPSNSENIQRRVPANKGPRYQAAVIDSDESSNNEEEIVQPPAKKKKTLPLTGGKKAVVQAMAEREIDEDVEEDGGSDASDDNMAADGERDDDQVALKHLLDEAPQFTSIQDEDGQMDDDVAIPQRRHCRASSTASSIYSGPPPTDNDNLSECGSNEENEAQESNMTDQDEMEQGHSAEEQGELEAYTSQKPTHKVSKKKAQQLEYELPHVTAESLPPSHTASLKTRKPPIPATAVNAITWKEQTNIIVSGRGRSFILGMTGQPTVMRKVMNEAINIGKVKMLVDHTYCPVGPELRQVAFAALVGAAEQLGYVEKNDVADRLQHGDNDTYIKPLTQYISQRIGAERKTLKIIPKTTVITTFGFTAEASSRAEASRLVLDRNYIYPKTGASPSYDYSRPFEHPVFSAYIHEMFFAGGTLYSSIVADRAREYFSSSLPSKPHELELPKAIVALATTAIHAILQDHARGGINDNFPSKELDGVYKVAIRILRGIETTNRMRYHKLMHSLYTEASGALPLAQHNMTNDQIYDSVDWTALAQVVTAEVDSEATTTNSTPTAAPPAAAATPSEPQSTMSQPNTSSALAAPQLPSA